LLPAGIGSSSWFLGKSGGELLATPFERYGFNWEWLSAVLGLLLAVFLGYRMSRVWFSWYLAVALAFNGHNNEAGGAARIEGFKHILRIRLKGDKLTVYVIGFDDAATELKDLKPRLVDKFDLESKAILNTK
jgi:hypothetical protein